MRANHLEKVLTAAMTTNQSRMNVLVTGAPGIGKTDLIQSVRRELGMELVMLHPAISDPTDFKGMPFVGKIGKTEVSDFIPMGSLRDLVEAVRPTMCFIDDIGQAAPSVQAALMQLIQERRIGDHRVSQHVRFVGATNRHKDRAGVAGLLEPVKSRFSTIVELTVDWRDWIEWAHGEGLPMEVIQFVRIAPQKLHDFTPTVELTNSPCPRTIHNAAKWIMAGLPDELLPEVIEGACGADWAHEFLTFRKIFRDMVDPDDVIKNPLGATIPDNLSAMYALNGALVLKTTAATITPIMQYINRLTESGKSEFAAAYVIDLVARDNKYLMTQEVGGFLAKNHGLFVDSTIGGSR